MHSLSLAYAPPVAHAGSFAARPAARPAPRVGPAGGAGGYGAPAARYRDAELASAAPGQLVVMLFDKCLLTVRRGLMACAANDPAARVDALCGASEMIAELRAGLDHDAGPEVAAISRPLDGLYAWTMAELFAVSRSADAARLGPVLKVLAELREAFAGAQAQLTDAPASAAQAG